MIETILALDVATRVGWASGVVGETPQFGSVNFSGKGGTGEVLARWRFWLIDRVSTLRPTIIAFESPYVPQPRTTFVKAGTEAPRGKGVPPMNPAVLRRLLAMCGLVEEIGFERSVRVRECVSGEFVKYFTGKGSWGGRDAKKEAVMRICRLHGWDVPDDNAGDACALWAYAEFMLSPDDAVRRRSGPMLELPLGARQQDRIGRRAVS